VICIERSQEIEEKEREREREIGRKGGRKRRPQSKQKTYM
jgi:general stress protein YciG